MTQGRKRNLFLVLALTTLAWPTVAQEVTPPAAIKEAGVLRTSVDAAFPPMNYKDADGNFVGIGVDIVKAIGEKFGVPVEMVESSYPQLMPGLETGRFDFIGSAMGDFPNRRESLTFVDYLKTGPQVFSLAKKKDELPTLDALCGRTAAHARFVTSYGIAMKALSDDTCTAADKPAINIQLDDLPVQIALAQNRFDAGVISAENVSYLMQIEPDLYYRIGEPLRVWYYGFGFKKDDVELRDAVSKAVQAIIDDGTYAEILEKHGVPELAIEAAKIDSGEF
ncbi:ABC transporter substrate-binding protein [Hoeflea alexandrii]|uniref:ABC transporter substrate-binding protein n=1 Tax=Hoeflea alexandrii TaxID=288436 RepID=UPI0022AF8AAD|nr:ABC transporter substrate-binding protein [Hoeflea alexandrii]MCZ4291516.1 ABC transporter substrate-binding protein [Hoeflea alexandrii]